MSTPLILAIVLPGIFAVLIRASVRLLVPGAIGPDTFAHLEVARQIRSNRHRLPATLKRLTLVPEYTYPFLYHWLLSLVPERRVRIAEAMTGPLADGLHTSAAALFAFVIFRSLGLSADDLLIGTAAVGALVAMSPAFLNMSGGPRAYIGSPRPVGQVLFMLFANAALIWGLTGDWGWLLLSACAAALLSVSSKFGNQAAVLISAAACLIGVFEPALACLAGYLLALIVWRGAFVRCMAGQVKHSIFYINHLQAPYLDRVYDTIPGYFERALTAARYVLALHPYPLDWLFADENPVHRLMVQFPAAVAGLALWIWLGFKGDSLFAAYWPFAGLVIASMIVSLFTSTRRFRFLGEHYRYLEHTVSTQAILATGLALGSGWIHAQTVFWAMILLGGLAFVSGALRMTTQYKPLIAEWSSIAEGTRSIDRPGTVVHAMGGLWWPVWSQTKELSIVHWAINCDIEALGVENFRKLYGNFPRAGAPFGELADTYGITHALGRTRDFEAYARETGDETFTKGGAKPIHSADGIELFAIGSTGTARS